VKWKGYNEITWADREDFDKCDDVIKCWKKNQKRLVIIKDMQKQLPLPKFNTQHTDYYRKRKLYVNNLGIYEVNTQKMHCYLWNEYQANKTADDIISCLHQHLQSRFDKNTTLIS